MEQTEQVVVPLFEDIKAAYEKAKREGKNPHALILGRWEWDKIKQDPQCIKERHYVNRYPREGYVALFGGVRLYIDGGYDGWTLKY